MKKKFVTFIIAVLTLVFGSSVLGGCNLVTTDEKKDMDQIVATVQISDDAKVDNIYKEDLVFAFLNNGYLFMQYYGYTQSQAVGAIMNSLIGNKIMLQTAMQYFAEKEGKTCTYNVRDYLTEDEYADALSEAYKEIDSLLNSYMQAEETAASDTLTETVRTVPTGATNATADEKKYTEVDVNSTVERRNAYDRFIRFLRNNSLLGDGYKGKVEETAYFEELLEAQCQDALLHKFEHAKTAEIRGEFTYDFINNVYKTQVDSEKEFNTTEFAEALANAKKASPVFYGAYGNYGYVYNLLLGASDIQKAQIAAIDASLTEAERKAEREEILKATTVKDLRSTWILSGYDFDGEKFTGDYAFLEDSIPFQGAVTLVKEADEEKGTKAEYRVDSLKTFDFDEFIEFMEEYVYGGATVGEEVENYEEKINELLFAFSTDPGSLNTYKGYVVSPDNHENWVADFAKAGKELLELGGTNYKIVATDYGYHVLFFSEAFDLGGAETLADYLGMTEEEAKTTYAELLSKWDDEDLNKEDFLYLFVDANVSSKVSARFTNYQNLVVNSLKDNGSRVKIYSDRYSDLVG